MFVLAAAFLVQGLAVVHGLREMQVIGLVPVILAYVALLLVPKALVGIGFADTWFRFRETICKKVITMEVILLQKIANLGDIGDRVKVKPGFGRNFLLPGGKATLATPENVAKFETRRAELEAKAAVRPVQSRAVARNPSRISAWPSPPRRAARASCSARSARPTSPKPASRRVMRSNAPKSGCRAARSARSAST